MSAAAALADDVAALYVDPRGPYPSVVRDWYDAKRDARSYLGSLPVVAHPPCGPWSSLRGLSKETEEVRSLGIHAVAVVRRVGGVLEHPSGSLLFEHCGMPKPGELPDEYGGLTFRVEQVEWGHVARKRSWLYVVGLPSVEALGCSPLKGAVPTHWVSGVHTEGARGKPPEGIKICSAQQRRRTPMAFAQWLVDLARECRRTAKASTETGGSPK